MSRTFRAAAAVRDDASQQHRDWLSLVEVSGPFLSPAGAARHLAHAGRARPAASASGCAASTPPGRPTRPAGAAPTGSGTCCASCSAGATPCTTDGLDALAVDRRRARHRDRARRSRWSSRGDGRLKPDTSGCSAWSARRQQPTARIARLGWAATPVDRLAQLCRAPRRRAGPGDRRPLVGAGVGAARRGHHHRRRSTPSPGRRRPSATWCARSSRCCPGAASSACPTPSGWCRCCGRSLDSQEEITEALGVQVRQAVELLVAAIGRADARDGTPAARPAADVERARGLPRRGHGDDAHRLPAVRRGTPAAARRQRAVRARPTRPGGSCAELEQRATEGSEEDLEHTLRRLAPAARPVHRRLRRRRPPAAHACTPTTARCSTRERLPVAAAAPIDDRTVLHMLRAGAVRRGRHRPTGSAAGCQLPHARRRADRLRLRGPALLRGLPRRRRRRRADRQGGRWRRRSPSPIWRRCASADRRTCRSLAKALAEQYKDSGIGSPAASGEEARTARRRPTRGGPPQAARRDRRRLPARRAAAAVLRDPPRGPARPARGHPARRAVRHRVRAAPQHRHPLHPALPRRGGRRGRAGAAGLRAGPAADRRHDAVEAEDQRARSSRSRSPTSPWARRRSSSRRPATSAGQLIEAWSREGDESRRAYLSALSTARSTPTRTRSSSRPAGRSSSTACTGWTSTRWPWRWRSCRSGWSPWTRTARSPSSTTASSPATRCSVSGTRRRCRERRARDLRLERDLAEARKLRQQLADLPDRADTLAEKRRLLDEVRTVRKRADAYADLVVGAQLASVKRGQDSVVIAARVGALAQQLAKGGKVDPLIEQAHAWLSLDQRDGGFDRDPLHWPLEFPEVFEQGGFDAIIGNPPFLGGKKISGPLGTAYREHLVTVLGRGVKGNADLVAYFLLRAHDLLNPGGQTGLIATNSLAQGDTREVGLDQLAADGVAIRQAVKSRPWPSQSAALEYCAVWTSRAEIGVAAQRLANGILVTGITPSLDPESRVTGNPYSLQINAEISFQGSIVLGLGFTMEPGDATALIAKEVVTVMSSSLTSTGKISTPTPTALRAAGSSTSMTGPLSGHANI